MTTTFKPGHHPDADQLSAFIEQALPAHERDGVLAHLAMCGDCRAVVALALPEESAAQPATVPRRAWFSNWMIFLPAAAAVAALAGFIFFVHRQGPAPQEQAQVSPAPVSVVQPQPSPASPAESKAAPASSQSEIEVQAKPLALSDDRETANAAAGSARAIGSVGAGQPTAIRPAAPQVAAVQNQSVQSLPAPNTFNSFARAANNGVVSQNQSTDQASEGRNALQGEAIGGPIRSSNNAEQAEANGQNQQQQNGLRQTVNQTTVQVQAKAPAVATEPVELGAVIADRAVSNLSFTRQRVPSGLPILSSATQGPIVLAVDTHHVVFVSSDSGQHWKTVRPVWKGHAVMVEATAPVEKFVPPPPRPTMGLYAGLPQGAVAAKKAGITLTGVVTDPSGAVIPGATVVVTDPQTHLARTLTTDASGRYIAAGLNPGNYALEATARGFINSNVRNIDVAASQPNVANFTLRVGAATEAVTVEDSAASLEVESAPEPNAAAELKAAPKEKVKQAPAPLFEIVTDKGTRWTSADGLTWQPK